MAQDPTRVSAGDYSATAYDVLSKYDPAFADNVSVEFFIESLQNDAYAAKAYAILADADPELVNNLSLDEFISNVKKKRGARRYGVCIGRWFFGATACS
jgi:hypothetical protein